MLKNSLTLLLVCLALLQGAAQSRSELERKRKQQEQEIKTTRKLLQETEKKQKATLNQLEIISSQIKTRIQLINTIGEEISLVDQRIQELETGIVQLQADLKILKDQYAEMIRAAYKHRNTYDKLMYILAAESFDQALMRMKYLQQFSYYRQKQVKLVLTTQQLLSDRLAELKQVKDEKQDLLGDKESEKQELEQDKKVESKVLSSLQEKEKELRAQLRKKEESARKLKKAIEDLIKREIEAARKRAEAEAKKNPPAPGSKAPAVAKKGEMTLTPEGTRLANEFSSNKGNLPWPVEQGFISKSFGVHPHPTLRNISVNNTGVDISTTKDASVRAIFRGTVKMKFQVPGMGYAVIVSHGDYFTVYTNLEEVMVKEGDLLNTKQVIGHTMYNDVEEKTEMHLEIYKGQNRLDPADWLFRK